MIFYQPESDRSGHCEPSKNRDVGLARSKTRALCRLIFNESPSRVALNTFHRLRERDDGSPYARVLDLCEGTLDVYRGETPRHCRSSRCLRTEVVAAAVSKAYTKGVSVYPEKRNNSRCERPSDSKAQGAEPEVRSTRIAGGDSKAACIVTPGAAAGNTMTAFGFCPG
jgi:hypothetical protein